MSAIDSTPTASRETILDALAAFVAQRPGLDFANYGSASGYRADYARILQAKRDAERMLDTLRWRHSITVEDLAAEMTDRERLTWNGTRLDYTTGQYWPTEYRAAVCRVLSRVLFNYWRDSAPVNPQNGGGKAQYARQRARAELGRGIANRWFD